MAKPSSSGSKSHFFRRYLPTLSFLYNLVRAFCIGATLFFLSVIYTENATEIYAFTSGFLTSLLKCTYALYNLIWWTATTGALLVSFLAYNVTYVIIWLIWSSFIWWLARSSFFTKQRKRAVKAATVKSKTYTFPYTSPDGETSESTLSPLSPDYDVTRGYDRGHGRGQGWAAGLASGLVAAGVGVATGMTAGAEHEKGKGKRRQRTEKVEKIHKDGRRTVTVNTYRY